MQKISPANNYREVFEATDSVESNVHFADHLGGFNKDFGNHILDTLHNYAVKNQKKYNVYLDNPIEQHIQVRYPNFNITYVYPEYMFDSLYTYRTHPSLTFKNFLCSFNNSGQIGRQLLVSILNKFSFYNPDYCSKNFIFNLDSLDGHLEKLLSGKEIFYKKFFISSENNNFFSTTNSFGDTVAIQNHYSITDHNKNIYRLENKLADSFLHIVSESQSTTYYPIPTEKFLYSVVTRGLYLSYAQPRWHQHLYEVWGFKPYTKIFNYDFDRVENPVIRLVELITMISKFSKLSQHDWHDIYQIEGETIEYNYDHYFSKRFKQHLMDKLPHKTSQDIDNVESIL